MLSPNRSRRGPTPRPGRRALVLAAVVGLGVLPALPAGAAPTAPDDASSTEQQLEELTTDERALLDELDGIGDDLTRLDEEIAAITAAEADVNRRLAEAEVAAQAAEARHNEARRQLDEARDSLRHEAVDLYITGGELRQHMAASVLDTTEMLDVYRATVYGDALLDQQQIVVDDYQRVRAETAAAEAEAERQKSIVEAERSALEAELERREALRVEQQRRRGEHEAMLADLQTRRLALEAELAADSMSSDGLGAELHARQATQPLAVPAPGSLHHPVPTNHRIGSPFGMRMHPILGYARPHRGADFGCAVGESIVAAADGVVAVAGPRGGYGNAVVIDHGGRFTTLYGHNSRLDVAVGDQVVAGQQIAACGSTGLSTGPHSHFETRVDGNPVDPMALLPGSGGSSS